MYHFASKIKPRSYFMKYRFCPPCITCKYIMLDHLDPFNIMKARCTKFAVGCRITGIVEYEHAIKCRDDTKKCGNVGFYYENRKLGP